MNPKSKRRGVTTDPWVYGFHSVFILSFWNTTSFLFLFKLQTHFTQFSATFWKHRLIIMKTFESFSNKTDLQKPTESLNRGEKRSWKRSREEQRFLELAERRLTRVSSHYPLLTSAGTRWHFMCFCPVKCQRSPSSRPTTPLNSEKRSEQGRPLGGETFCFSPLGFGNISLTRVGAEPCGCGDVTRHRAARRVSAEVSPDGEEESFCCLHSSSHAVSVEHQERSRKELSGVRCAFCMFVNKLF